MNTDKNKRTDEILNSLDGLKKATAPDFFYVRLKARMEREIRAADPIPGKLLRPAYALMVLAVVLLMNVAVIFTKNSSGEAISSTSEMEALQSIAAEYSPTDVSNLYDLNDNR